MTSNRNIFIYQNSAHFYTEQYLYISESTSLLHRNIFLYIRIHLTSTQTNIYIYQNILYFYNVYWIKTARKLNINIFKVSASIYFRISLWTEKDNVRSWNLCNMRRFQDQVEDVDMERGLLVNKLKLTIAVGRITSHLIYIL